MPDNKLDKVLQKLSYKGIISQFSYAISIPPAFVYPLDSLAISFIIAII